MMTELQERLDAAVRDHCVVGASLAILDGGELHLAASGVADDRMGASVTPDTLFGIWSLTKPMTTMAVLSLEREGRLSLDDAVYDVVPELSGAEAGDGLLMRHLLECTSGLPGLFFPEVGDGPDALSRVIPLLAGHRRIHVPGERWAYSNLGFVVAGVIAERLTGQMWDEVLRERVLDPLRLADTFSVPSGTGGRSVAVNHLVESGEAVNLGEWYPRSSGPAGGTVVSTAADLCRFGAALCGDDRTLMRTPRVRVPGPHMDWALGMASFGWGVGVVGWDGVGPGGRAFLRVLPRHGAVIALLTASDNGRAIYRSLIRDLLAERWSVQMAAERPPPVGDPGTAREILDAVEPGVFRCAEMTATISSVEGHLLVECDALGSEPLRALPVDPGVFLIEQPIDYPIVTVDGDLATISCFGFRRHR